ncbi:MAG: hypothetical protein B6D65_03735 [candidate division Zixibacteria bacterium 4484_93]|nr:MAG: hypothetical protein B6D65_03735 [candidate division Zixibacteria bacterium 4484_93]
MKRIFILIAILLPGVLFSLPLPRYGVWADLSRDKYILVDTRFSYRDYTRFYSPGRVGFVELKDSLLIERMLEADVTFSPTREIFVQARIPYKERLFLFGTKAEANGIGDIVAILGYRNRISDEIPCLFVGASFPTGDTASDSPLGTGSFDITVGVSSVTRDYQDNEALDFSGHLAIWLRNLTGNEDVELSNEAEIDYWIRYPVYIADKPRLGLVGETYILLGENIKAHYLVDLTLGIFFTPIDCTTVELSCSYPVLSKDRENYQFSPSLRLSFSVPRGGK